MNVKEPLASIIRPTTIDQFVGQDHLVGEGKPLRVAIENGHLFSMIFWGPPGVGKTTLAKIYANSLHAEFHELSAVSAGKADIREIVENTKDKDKPTILFLDEIHRFNKAQQDFLLPYVEKGILTLIGASTENPSFEVISPLLSRCRVFVMNELKNEEITEIINRALNIVNDELESEKKQKLYLDDGTKDWIINFSNGDARQAITLIESSFRLYGKITVETLKDTVQSKFLRYDKNAEEHYNTISAFIKSMRAGDADAAVYYLARMIDSGEDPLFIARRMVIFASEDVGNASPTALVVANNVFSACEKIGYPECAINLSQGVIFLAKCKKDRSAYNAIKSAQEDAKKYGNLQIPYKLRNPETNLRKEIGYGDGYKMYDKESLLPEILKDRKYVVLPKDSKDEKEKKQKESDKNSKK